MTNVSSQVNTISVVTSQSGTLAAQAAAMLSGEWAKLDGSSLGTLGTTPRMGLPGGLGLFTNTGGNSGTVIAYTDKFAVDASLAAKKLHFVGSDHGGNSTTAASKYLVYDEATNAWTAGSTTPPFSFNGNTPQHQYDNGFFDSTRNKFWFKNGTTFWRFDGSNVWTAAISGMGGGYDGGIGASCYFPDRDRILYCVIDSAPNGILIETNPVTGAHATLASGATLAGMANYQEVMRYSALRQLVYFGGGSGGTNKIWTCNAAGVVTLKDTPPITINVGGGINIGGGNANYCFVNPANGNLIVYAGKSTWYELNPTAAPGSQWSANLTATRGNVVMLNANTYDVDAAASMASDPVYGCVVFVKAVTPSAPAEMWLWKP